MLACVIYLFTLEFSVGFRASFEYILTITTQMGRKVKKLPWRNVIHEQPNSKQACEALHFKSTNK